MSCDPMLYEMARKLVRFRRTASRRWFFYNGECIAFVRLT